MLSLASKRMVVSLLPRQSPLKTLHSGILICRSFHILNARPTFALCLTEALRRPKLVCWTQRNFRRTAAIKAKNRAVAIYAVSGVVFVLGVTYAAVPLYRLYCQATGTGNRAIVDQNTEKVEKMKPVKDRVFTVKFFADASSRLAWNFRPAQNEVKISPGETALAFYTARNPLDKAITGVATYSVAPYEAGQYLNKIQCFCFEEQRLNPNEEVDMPVFFYFDPEMADDHRLESTDTIVLSYTFFEAKEGFKLPFQANEVKAVQ